MTDLIVLSGAAFVTGRPNTKNFQGGVSITVAGGMDAGVAYVLDGAMHNDPQNAGGLPLPFPDAMQEFRVATSGLSAQNGMHSGASVNAVTKSGSNVFHGNAFEFLRHHQFNATNPFAIRGADGKRVSDGLRRNQFGGTIGGPIARDRLFFFGGYQGTMTRVASTSNIAYVPTAAMLAGDFTAFASAACNSGRAITLRAPFVNNRVDRALFSPAALNIAGRLPTTDDPCGETKYAQPDHRDEGQAVSRVDYQMTGSQTLFGRYMLTFHKAPSSFSLADGNILATHVPGINNYAQSMTLGHTTVMGANMVNSARFAFNRTTVDRRNSDYFGPEELGIKITQLLADEGNTAGGDQWVRDLGRAGVGGPRREQLLPVQRRSDDGAGAPRARARRERGVLASVHEYLVAERRELRVQRPDHRVGARGLSPRPGLGVLTQLATSA